MRKIIIIEGMDNTGKDTVVNSIVPLLNDPDIIHCDKPKATDPAAAEKEQNDFFEAMVRRATIEGAENDIVFNRSWYGEYVYGCLYRGRSRASAEQMIKYCDLLLKTRIEKTCPGTKVYFIFLDCSSMAMLCKNDDGKSMSGVDVTRMTAERKRFGEAFYLSAFPKAQIFVNDVYGMNSDKFNSFRDRHEIMNDVIKFLLNDKL